MINVLKTEVTAQMVNVLKTEVRFQIADHKQSYEIEELDVDKYPLYSGKHLDSYLLGNPELESFLNNPRQLWQPNRGNIKGLIYINCTTSKGKHLELVYTASRLTYSTKYVISDCNNIIISPTEGKTLYNALTLMLKKEATRAFFLKHLLDCKLNYPDYHRGDFNEPKTS